MPPPAETVVQLSALIGKSQMFHGRIVGQRIPNETKGGLLYASLSARGCYHLARVSDVYRVILEAAVATGS